MLKKDSIGGVQDSLEAPNVDLRIVEAWQAVTNWLRAGICSQFVGISL